MQQFFIQPDKIIIDTYIEGIPGWWIEDELANKINSLYPFFNFIIEDGELIDVEDDPDARATAEAEKLNQVAQPTLDDVIYAVAELAQMITPITGQHERVLSAEVPSGLNMILTHADKMSEASR